jgi:hypothetical protein
MTKVASSGIGSRGADRCRTVFAWLLALVAVCFAPAASAKEDVLSALATRIEAAADALRDEPRLRPLSDHQRRELVQFVAGNILFVTLHEFGHVVISEMGIPVVGREEDAADSLATLIMLRMRSDFSDKVLTSAAQAWFFDHRKREQEGRPIAYHGAHGLSRQRAYYIVCLMVGSDPVHYAGLAEQAGLPRARRQSCMGDYSNASWSWRTLLKAHKRTTEPRTTIDVVYRAGGERLDAFVRSLQSVRLLDTVAHEAANEFVWRRSFRIEAKSCGAPGAHWNLATQTLTICYELAEAFAILYREHGPLAQPSPVLGRATR